jgi:hypothetical protein
MLLEKVDSYIEIAVLMAVSMAAAFERLVMLLSKVGMMIRLADAGAEKSNSPHADTRILEIKISLFNVDFPRTPSLTYRNVLHNRCCSSTVTADAPLRD